MDYPFILLLVLLLLLVCEHTQTYVITIMATALMIFLQDGLSSYFTISFTTLECLVDKAEKESRVAALRYMCTIDVCVH